MTDKKHPCPDCTFCQWCSDDRCNLCLRSSSGCKKKLSTSEQIALYDSLNLKSDHSCGINETIDPIRAFDLQIIQPKSGYRFSLDPLLLCEFAPENRLSILDIGSGSGVIALVMAKKSPMSTVTGIELQAEMAAIATRNAALNGLSQRVNIIGADISKADGIPTSESFDLVLCNPPYRTPDSGRVSPKKGRDLARHESSATLAEFLSFAKRMVKPEGSICFIYQTERLPEMLYLARGLKLSTKRLQMVHDTFTSESKIFMVEFVKGRSCALEVLPPVSVRDSAGVDGKRAGMR